MAHPPAQLHFLAEPVEHRRVAGVTQADGLDGDLLAQLQILGLVHLAHAAGAEQPDHAKTAEQQRARTEARPVTVRIGRKPGGIEIGRERHSSVMHTHYRSKVRRCEVRRCEVRRSEGASVRGC